jgi:hypothetical protein
MSPVEIEALAPLIGFLVTAFVVSIPVIAFSARFAIKPIADAMVRLREAQGGSRAQDETLLLQHRRMSLMEAELQHMHAMMERLVEADRFRTELESAQARAALPGGPKLG